MGWPGVDPKLKWKARNDSVNARSFWGNDWVSLLACWLKGGNQLDASSFCRQTNIVICPKTKCMGSFFPIRRRWVPCTCNLTGTVNIGTLHSNGRAEILSTSHLEHLISNPVFEIVGGYIAFASSASYFWVDLSTCWNFRDFCSLCIGGEAIDSYSQYNTMGILLGCYGIFCNWT